MMFRIFACEAIPVRDRIWIQFAIGTGLREGEMFNLRLSDLVLGGDDPHVIVQRGSKDGGPKNTRTADVKIRRVPLFGPGLDAVRRWMGMLPSYCPSNPHGLVFPGPTGARKQPDKHLHRTRCVRVELRDGTVVTKVRPFNPLPEYLAAAGIVAERRHDGRHVRWHDLRHTFASSLVSGTWGRRWSLEEVRAAMGHESITTTERYAHLADTALKIAARETNGGLVRQARATPASSRTDAKNGAQVHEIIRSHLGDLNPRPAVYETAAFLNDGNDFGAVKPARQAYEDVARALADLANGRAARAIALLGTMLDDCAPEHPEEAAS